MSYKISRRKWLEGSIALSSSLFIYPEKTYRFSRKKSLKAPFELSYDIVVCGGGPGGVCAAIAAARLKKKVLLIERYGFLGGMATAGLVQPFMEFETNGQLIVRGIFEEVRNRLTERGGYSDGERRRWHAFDAEVLKMVEQEMCIESGVEILYHAFIREVVYDHGNIQSVIACTKGGDIRIDADIFIDATGDGDVAYLSGADFKKGRDGDGLMQPATLFFEMSNVDESQLNEYIDLNLENKKFDKTTKTAQEKGDLTHDVEETLWIYKPEKGTVSFNVSRLYQYDATNPFDLTKLQIEGLKQVYQIAEYAKKYLPGFKNATISKIAPQVGIRETRRIAGDYTVTENDLLSLKEFPDRIGRGCYEIDVHTPDGKGEGSWIHFPKGESYTIPFRSLLVTGKDNLIMGCRAISATHIAHGALRVQPNVMTIGQAAGTAAALALEKEMTMRDLPVDLLQERLRKDNVVI
jgi:hypothetical protein